MGLIIIIKRLLTPSLNGHFVDRFVNTQEADELLCLFSKYRQRHIPHTSHSHLADHDHHYLTSSVMAIATQPTGGTNIMWECFN